MPLNIILARARNGTIGVNNTLPWHLPEDLAHFKKTTLGCPVVMGRKTWESIPQKFRPLPGRVNIVLSRSPEWRAAGASVLKSLEEVIARFSPNEEIWVIGGAAVYQQCLKIASRAVVTEIDADFEGDAYAPVFDSSWRETGRSRHTAANGLVYSLIDLLKTGD